jgi:hypothetical protein
MVLAVPVAAVIGVLAAFAIAQYRSSPYYGTEADRPVTTKPEKVKKQKKAKNA